MLVPYRDRLPYLLFFRFVTVIRNNRDKETDGHKDSEGPVETKNKKQEHSKSLYLLLFYLFNQRHRAITKSTTV